MAFTPCFAAKNNETIISYINLNNIGFYDIEIMLTQDDKILLPFKQLSEIFEVKVKTNHAVKEVIFETSDGKKGIIGLHSIEFDGKKISSKNNLYIKDGLMEDIKDEIYCDENDLSIIFDSKIRTDKNDLSIIATTKRNLKLLQTDEEEFSPAETKIKTYSNVLKPDKERKIQLNSISLNNNTMNDSVSQYFINRTQKNVFFNNNLQIIFKGKLYSGDFNADLNTYNYKGELFSFGGLGFNYHKNHKGYDYEIGRVRGIKNDSCTIGNQMLGFQMSNYEFKLKSYRELNGNVAKDSLVKVFVDKKEHTILSTYDGYYSLNNLYLNKNPESIKLEELKSDGSTQTIYEKTYPKIPNMPREKEKKYTVLGGVTGYNNKLFNTNGYIYEMNTKKFLLASQYEYGIKENIKFDTKLSFDKIYSQPKNAIWQNIYSTDALLTSGTWKNPNNLEGVTSLNSIEYIKNDNLKSELTFGASGACDISKNKDYMGGLALIGETSYAKDNYTLKAGLFSTSADFYLAGGDGSFYNDRTGGFLSGSVSGKNIGMDGSYRKYFSNASKQFEGGLINFNEYSLGLHKSFEKICNARFNITGRDGSNSIAENKSYYYDLNFSKKLGYLDLQAGKTESNYQTTYNKEINDYKGFKSLYSTIYLKGDFNLPKNLGIVSLGHDVIKYDYSNKENKYNMIKINYTFPEIKRITLSVGTGYKYTGSDKGFDFFVNLAYRTKSGRTINLNYQFNKMGGCIINNMYLPMNNRHSVNIVINDAFAVLQSRLKSVGYNDDNHGYAITVVYIDKNKNGKFDKGDIPVKDIPIKFSWVNDTIYTNHRGKAFPSGVDAGIYKVKIDTDKLPATISTDKNMPAEKLVRIDSRKNTLIEFPVKSCVGNITGKLKIIDDFGRPLNITDFIVVLNDENGEETAYSTVDGNGQFYFSGVEPGKYTIKLDDYFINTNALESFENKSILTVDIPYTYKKFVDINDLKLVYKVH